MNSITKAMEIRLGRMLWDIRIGSGTREKPEISRSKLAAKVDKDPGTVRNTETGASFDCETWEQFIVALDHDPAELLQKAILELRTEQLQAKADRRKAKKSRYKGRERRTGTNGKPQTSVYADILSDLRFRRAS